MNSNLTYSSIICDYITVFFEDGNISDGVGEWDIPASSYYYQDRGTMAQISVADAAFGNGSGRNVLIGIDTGFNGTVAQEGSADLIKNNIAMLGTFQMVQEDTNARGGHFYKTEPIKVLTPARPSKIKVYFFNANTKEEYDIDGGCLILKFEYLSPDAEKAVSHLTAYTAAFPEPKDF
tara:strand:- start:872 stop:1405 length:534 start_codon:yes stop_codon:yes gene_type:complete